MHEENELTEQVPDTDPSLDLATENENLRAKLQELSEKSLESEAQKTLSMQYADFNASFDDVKQLCGETPYLASLPPEERYRAAYLMLCGKRYLDTDAKLQEEKILEALAADPAILQRYAKRYMKNDAPVRFALGKSAGIHTEKEEPAKTLSEAKHAALRYAKAR